MPPLAGTALALSGGGAPAVGLAAGFGLAWDLFLLSHSLNDVEHFSGVSAGAIASAYWASGVTPVELIRAQFGKGSVLRSIDRDDFYAVNWEELLPAVRRLPRALAGVMGQTLRRGADGDVPTLALLRAVLPSSLFASRRLAAVVRANLVARCGDSFQNLPRRLTIRVFDAREGRPVVCGHGGDLDVPVSTAVRGSITYPILFDPLPMRVAHGDRLVMDGGVAGATFEVHSFGPREVVIVLDTTNRVRVDGERMDLLEAAKVALGNLFHQLNREEIADFINQNRGTHVLYFGLGEVAEELQFFSYADAHRAARVGFEATRERLAADFDYLDMVFRPRGVRLNPEIARANFEDALSRGEEYKKTLKVRHGVGGGPE